MTVGGGPRCPDCGAQLRRGRSAGEYCDPCRRRGPGIVLPEGFYDQGVLQAALAELNFGPVFCAVRIQKQCSQQALGELLGWEQRRISAIETGRRPLVNLPEVVHVANTLGIPAGKLGFIHGITVGGRTGGQKGSWVHRRDFVERVGALTVGVTGVVGLDLDRLRALLPEEEPTGTRHLGAADVDAIEAATATFKRQDLAQGSGLVRDLAVTQLRATLPLLGAQMAPEVRPRLLLATAHLALQVGYMSFDVHQHDAARRFWMIGLDVARTAEHPQGSDLTVYLLYDLALQAVHLQRPDEALRLVHFGHAAAAGTDVSPSTTSALASIQARAHAAQGNAAGCDRALGQAVEELTTLGSATRPPWGAHLDHGSLAARQGTAHYELASAGRDPYAANRAVPLLRSAVDGFGPDRARARALCLPDLAGAHALAGDIDTAVAVGHQAIDAVTALHSPQAYERLRVLHTALGPRHTSPGVAELRSRLAATLA